jgi:DUF3089 family protein
VKTARLLLLASLTIGCLPALPAAAGAKTVWLCKPGLAENPCAPSLKTTRFSPTGAKLGVDFVKAPRGPKFDCFYVYPTVSDQKTVQANLSIDPEERSIALYQAARYSRDCRVFAPMYRQITVGGLFSGRVTSQVSETTYGDVRSAWRTYLKKYNKGRGVVLIGHSQGSFFLRRLITQEVDPKPKARRRLISAVLLGGNVLVKRGEDAGGDFKNIPACRAKRQFGCVIAFSTFDAPVPAHSLFGRVSGIDALFGLPARQGVEVLCTNPAALGGGSARVDPTLPTQPFAPGTSIGAGTLALGFAVPASSTPWAEFPGAYKARCSSEGGANVLQITPRGSAPTLNPVPNAIWGVHLVDANIALGNLTGLVERQAAAYLASR